MANLRDLMRAVQEDLPITVRHERWLLENAEANYSDAAIQFSDDFLRGRVGGNRKGRRPAFRASGMGSCPRKRVFARLGTSGVSEQFSSTQANTFASGNFFHRKWQMAGLTEGWLVAVEVPLENLELDLAGTADGIIYDGSLFEFKTINDRGYRWVQQSKRPKEEHLLQVGAYKLLHPAFTAASIVYENKNTGEWREFRVQFTDELMEQVDGELASLRKAMVRRELPPVKPDCSTREGFEYRQCPFREICLSTSIWPKGVTE